jgi:hypothetical protein
VISGGSKNDATLQAYLAAVRRLQTDKHARQGCLAAAALPNNADGLTGLGRNGCSLHCLH